MKHLYLLCFLLSLVFLYGCTSNDIEFIDNNSDIISVNGKKCVPSPEFISYQHEISNLYKNTFTNEEIAILMKTKSDTKLSKIRKQIMHNYSVDNVKSYLTTLKSILGEEIYRKLTSSEFRKQQSEILIQYNKQVIKNMQQKMLDVKNKDVEQ